ncbi:MAG: ATP-binding protein [Pseudomonadota bacterium]
MNKPAGQFLFTKFSIRAKLFWITILTSTTALVLAGFTIVTYDSITYKEQRISDLTAQAEILGAISSAAVIFNDAKAAREYLSSLRAKPLVVAAIIYDKAGHVFATYNRSGSTEFNTTPTEADGHRIESNDILLFRSIMQGGQFIGTVHLRADLGLKERLVRYAGIVLGLLILSLGSSLLLSTRLQAMIAKPLLEVTQTARQVIDHHDYSQRAIKYDGDEVGVLVDAFNQMLTQIQLRETALQAANKALQLEIAEHKLARAEVAELNETLEKRVMVRTAELAAANKELESFSYSVSHDLRTPLRGIDGFTLILLENYANKLDEQGRHYLVRIRNATDRMSHLIDDLLQLSRTIRSEMNLTEVNLSELASSIANDLHESMPERKVEFLIEPNIIIQADVILMRVALENLLNNAWKFTGKKSLARIEVGSTIIADKKTYFVRDNGTGFDMKYVEKLFGAFQRLHSISEFEGTGVGLANVQRIIHRHGGQIWADAKLNEGATFYFTLSAWRKIS